MGICRSHEACPSCRKMGRDRHGDNLGIYDDGSAYCFSCGYYKPGNGPRNDLKAPRSVQNPELVPKPVSLPFDASNRLDLVHNEKLMVYLKKYRLKGTTAFENHLMWSESRQRLIFPLFSGSDLVAWQGRYFGSDPKQPKWYSQGDLKNYLYIKRKELCKAVTLVEDIVSTIVYHKADSLVNDCVCLFGSTISDELILRLKLLNYERVTIWLDYDKRIEAYKYKEKYDHLFKEISVKSTSDDPKDYLI